jgi:parallel beta-helix repeat protein
MIVTRLLLSFSLLLTTIHATSITIGARNVAPSLPTTSSLYAHPKGEGTFCTKEHPCNIQTAIKKLQPDMHLFLYGGTYYLHQSIKIAHSGTKDHPIMIESMPKERAILNGRESKESILKNHHVVRDGILIQAKKYITIKNIDITQMGARGINILYSSHITIEGCRIYNNHLSGITIYGGNYDAPYKPYKYGYNLIKDNIIYHNSDAGIYALQKADGYTYSYERGDNADGISVSSGKFNRIIHNTVYANSDDGIDLWRSNNSYVAYNLVYDNGRGKGGNGNGIKAGGNRHFDNKADAPNGKLALVEHNIACNNKRIGFDINSGKKVTFRYNTAWKNGAEGFTSYDDTIVEYNIASNNQKKSIIRKKHCFNSWQMPQQPTFISTNIKSQDFLKPTPHSPFATLGAYADEVVNKKQHHERAKLFLIGDSTMHNTYAHEAGWGDALASYLTYPQNLFNLAQSGASSHSYKNTNALSNNWHSTKKIIQQSDLRHGAYLFIQFGHNNKKRTKKAYHAFEEDLKFYIDEARNLHLTPVLITPIQRFWKYDVTHAKIPDIVKKVAKEKGVLLLDLQAKSKTVFDHYKSHDALAKDFGYDDHTHFNKEAAKKVAGWVKILACQQDKALCQLFK